MAIIRVKDILQVEKFEWEGVTFGLRLPNVAEMKVIVDERARYVRTMRDEYAKNKADGIFVEEMTPEGDVSILLELQQRVSEMLVVDPEQPSEKWFAYGADDPKFKSGDKELVTDWPASFHQHVYGVFSKATSSKDDTKGEKGEGGDAPLALESESGDSSPASTTESVSNGTSSASQGGSEVSTPS